ncbi:MAG TPA: hypothetical protein V6D26_10120 [Stenomitos sp.]
MSLVAAGEPAEPRTHTLRVFFGKISAPAADRVKIGKDRRVHLTEGNFDSTLHPNS